MSVFLSFSFEGGMWDLPVLIPDYYYHFFAFYFVVWHFDTILSIGIYLTVRCDIVFLVKLFRESLLQYNIAYCAK